MTNVIKLIMCLTSQKIDIHVNIIYDIHVSIFSFFLLR